MLWSGFAPGEFALSAGFVARTRQFFRELKDFFRLFAEENRAVRQLCFYSERDIYYRYFEGYISYVLNNSELDVCYLTSDPNDPVFDLGNPRLKIFYVNHLVPSTFRRLDAKALVLTMPDLDLYHVKRSRNPVNHVYLFHGVGSIHLQYNKRAFDAYDTIFCLGPYDHQELRRAEELYQLPAKKLVETGYYWIEKIFRDHQDFSKAKAEPPQILVAPSWHDENILALCLAELLRELDEASAYQVTLRPHPETIKRKPHLIESIQGQIEARSNVKLELNMVSGLSLHQADVLITDWSAICFEYAFGTERPVLFIDTPCKVQNQDYRELGIEPVEFTTRAEIGLALAPGKLAGLSGTIDRLIAEREGYRQRIIECRKRILSSWLRSDRVGGEHLIELCGGKSMMRKRSLRGRE